ncbi:class I SAM-dependent methyltransferase [Pseudaminobacter sp. 19-2017]|uniref:Class I SAM-dependent methyltransferase n=1 Tax=Pseudaminobacter soli (ex Zhang et al. 2022) TaxID=2831468 RepID=A0A942E8M0_9HYPH|nr:class I SAM-dependent methyltransferase [Pseudaminobacter soli]MBS3650427.1 class I SAM-dependent methyltransferase [Pseudaminobacter soli]
MQDLKSYWNGYYASQSRERRPVPSQFAVFVQGELASPHLIVDVGCGNGRDTIFFSSYGNAALGVDGSSAAVEYGQALADRLGMPARFASIDVNDKNTLVRTIEEAKNGDLPLLIYARFFIHAIDDAAQAAFLDTCAQVCKDGDRLAFEFRTVRDKSLEKVTESHYRRFVEPSAFLAEMGLRGFSAEYFVEGFGFAKYKSDDAYVARFMCTKRS